MKNKSIRLRYCLRMQCDYARAKDFLNHTDLYKRAPSEPEISPNLTDYFQTSLSQRTHTSSYRGKPLKNTKNSQSSQTREITSNLANLTWTSSIGLCKKIKAVTFASDLTNQTLFLISKKWSEKKIRRESGRKPKIAGERAREKKESEETETHHIHSYNKHTNNPAVECICNSHPMD